MPKTGSPEDRGSADAYYGRPLIPHFHMTAPNGAPVRVGRYGMTDDMVRDYISAYKAEEDRKDYG